MTTPLRVGAIACPICRVLMLGDAEAVAICPSCSAAWLGRRRGAIESLLLGVRNWPADATGAQVELDADGLLCPLCTQRMERGEWDLVQTLECTGCGGSLVAGLTARRIANATTERHLRCPVCDVTMSRLAPGGDGSGSKLDVCPQCSATWFDWEDGGLEDALQAVHGWPPEAPQVLDEFSRAILRRLRCPACGHTCKAAMHGLVATARCTECWGELIPGTVARRIAGVEPSQDP